MRLRKKTYLTPFQLFEKSLRESDTDARSVLSGPVAKAGDLNSSSETDVLLSVRSAVTALETVSSGESTADDLSPETLIKEDGERPGNMQFDQDDAHRMAVEESLDHEVDIENRLLDEASKIEAYRKSTSIHPRQPYRG